MKILIDAIEIRETRVLPEDHFVEAGHKVNVQESLVEYGQAYATSDESEITQVIGVDARGRVDLQRVSVVA